ncbi:MAG TPA: DUF423 domain-containing protein [Chitinophagaceae bacterium]
MHRGFLAAGAVFGALAVALGAFGAHGLEKLTTDLKILSSYRTGVEYQVYHALALLATAIIFERFPGKWTKWAGNCFIAGIILFSGSLYLLSFLKMQASSTVKFIGPVTPLGGVLFIAGWLFLLIAVTKKD